MGNSLGCSASGERLVSAARDGDAVEARMLLELSPALARYSTFGGLNSPLHFAAAKGHLDIVMLLLEKGADVNARNYCGQTALMHACRHGHWEVVQMLLLFRCNELAVLLCIMQPVEGMRSVAREFGLQNTIPSVDDSDLCAVCLERSNSVAAEGCGHEFCIKCALYLCSTSNTRVEFTGPPGSIPCPLCRNGIMSFTKLPSTPTEGLKSSSALTFCNPCILNTRTVDSPATVCKAEIRRNRVAAVSSELVCPLTCSPFPSSALPTCRCSDDDPCGATETQDDSEAQSPQPSHCASMEMDKREQQDLDRTSCSGMFWSRRSCHREEQCNAEINA
ncbi:hypothetical protein E2562_032911 [Oryza meyeriana var. granulata]|uniref:RING-type E3 ubiquitin transferase n=1 Tax=Oryza meyeriana var. granulata TaxID=110450 RepID=A0A6G1F0R8_9ORYZ|nr:hypothetical protein E2562_032911 [Oryza meyeriana var. granulata]